MSELSEAISEMRNMRESYDQIGAAAEAYNTGKVELAENITAKGIPASASETLPELAEKVCAIAQTQTILEGGEVMAAQQFGDGALWNLYQVLADMKTRFMGTGDYAALIVCEYYKGYDSLVLQGADGYYTCDGDLYEYASPTHVWHDIDSGKANRWVAFLYRDDGARLDITNTSISPRSMYIGGHIGTIEYFVNGRLSELVSGVEETDVVDNFLTKTFTQSFGLNCIIRGVKNVGPTFNTYSAGAVLLDVESISSGAQNGYNMSSAAAFFAPKVKSIISGFLTFVCNSAKIFSCDELESLSIPSWSLFANNTGVLELFYTPKLKSQTGAGIFNLGISSVLIDVWVGEMVTNLRTTWNPTGVLADATKKAQLIENIKNHILARVSDRTGLSQLVFTVSTNMYNNIASEEIEWNGETMSLADAFLTKNWLLAGA